MPNAPLGPAQRQRTDYLRRTLGIPTGKTIVLHTGNLGAHMGSHQLVLSARDWPDDWVLVCHTRLRYTEVEHNYMAALRYLAPPGRVLFSTEPVPQADYAGLVASADIGVAFYCPLPGSTLWGDNVRYTGLSSGKFAACLAAGMPVLVNDEAILQRMVEGYHCGASTADPAVTRPAIARILADYDACCDNAVACFNREMDVQAAFKGVLERIEALP